MNEANGDARPKRGLDKSKETAVEPSRNNMPRESVLLLLKIYKEFSHRLNATTKRTGKRVIWNKIAQRVQKQGYKVICSIC